MKVDDLIRESMEMEELKIIRERCSQFLEESKGLVLFKNLPSDYANFQKVKVRKRKDCNLHDKTFNEVFADETQHIKQRALFANGIASFQESTEEEDLEPFYVFPVDGYSYMYSMEIENSTTDYKQVFDLLLEEFGEKKGKEVISDLLRFNYTSDDLAEGIEKGCEIILYNIPYYYCIKISSLDNESDVLAALFDKK